MTTREAFLNKIQQNLGQALLPDAGAEHPGSFQDYSFQPDTPPDQLLQSFTTELETLAGNVHLADDIEGVAEKILAILATHGTKQIIAWDDNSLGLAGLSDILAKAGVEIVPSQLAADADGRKTNLADIDSVLVGLSGAQGGLADTGAIALISGSGQGRLASLLPPVHIAILSRKKLYPALPAFLSDNSSAEVGPGAHPNVKKAANAVMVDRLATRIIPLCISAVSIFMPAHLFKIGHDGEVILQCCE